MPVPVVHCQPPARKVPGKAVTRRCGRYLALEIRVLHPRLILTVGGRAAEAVLNRDLSIEREHGMRHRQGEAEVLTLLLPVAPSLKKRGSSLAEYRDWLTGLFGSLIESLP